MANNNQQIHIKKEVMTKLIEAFLSDNFEENTRLIPFDLRPQGAEVSFRCCIHKERAIIEKRVIADLGFPLENDDDRVSLTTYAKEALDREKIDDKNLTVLQSACKGCSTNTMFVTDLCQGCVARPCEKTCRFGAIHIVNGKSVIDNEKCKKCQMCVSVCPYHAIIKRTVPCEDTCPVGAIHKDEQGLAAIDYDKCINCGKCIMACPFGSIHEKSQIIDILKEIKNGKKVVAMIAPAVVGQFDGNIYQIKTAILKAGFSDVVEVAVGADITTHNEASEFVERMEQGKPFMTTSCCAGYIRLVKKHLKEIQPYVSDTQTPLYYTAEMIKKQDKEAITVFVSPCVAKRAEGFDNENVDYVLGAEELDSLFDAKKIVVSEQEETKIENEPSKQARNFAVTGGVALAVKQALKDENLAKPMVVSGLNKDSIKMLKKCATQGKTEDGSNLIEVMCCEGGCVCGDATVKDVRASKKIINNLLSESKDIEKNA